MSVENNARLGTLPGACLDVAAAVDSGSNLHVVWTNGRQVLHRIRSNGVWSDVISRLSANYLRGIAAPMLAVDVSRVYIAYLERNAIILS